MSEEEQPCEVTKTSPNCLNCDAKLTGQYCGDCGQRAHGRFISVWELFRDALGDLMDVDSRLWRTLIMLSFRPGRLTSEYLRGRRARYMPPFRTYLVLSLLFFFVAFFDTGNFGILFEPTEDDTASAEAPPLLSDEDRQTLTEELAKEGIHIAPMAEDPESGRSSGLSIGSGDEDFDCSVDGYDPTELPGWLGRRLTKERMQETCQRLTSGGEEGLRGYFQRLLELIPAGLFVLLPVIALVLKLLYPLSRRYYVEHLLMIINLHSFVFLALTVQALLSRGGDLVGLPGLLMSLLLWPIVIYIPVYFYKTLRVVYGQGHMLTSLKYLLLFLAYSAGLTVMLLIMIIFTVFLS